MMYKKKSGAGRKMKALALVPMFVLALCITAIPAVKATVSTISDSKIVVDKDSGNSSKDETNAQIFQIKSLNNNDNRTTIVIQGENLGNNISVSGGTFTTMGKTHEAKSLQCDLTDGDATITATFPFISEFENSSMTLTINGKEVLFDLEKFFNKSPAIVADVMPQYPGGEAAMMQAVMAKAKFPDPKRPWKDGASGLTVVGFTVYPDGSMEDFHIINSSGYGDLDAYAIQAIKEGLTVKWIPGTSNGKPVAVSYALPIRYKQM